MKTGKLQPSSIPVARLNEFVFGGGMKSVQFPQLPPPWNTPQYRYAGNMRVIACGWPAVHRGQLVFFSHN
jgi:hypothetical protein